MIPPPTLTITPIDSGALGDKLGRMAEVFYRRGAQPTALQRFVEIEAGQWAGDAADILGPKTESEGMDRVKSQVKGQLTTVPLYSNLDDDQQFSKYGDFTWLQAGPNFLLGINDEDNQAGTSPEAALKMYRAGQKSTPRGSAQVRLGKIERTGQIAYRLNRVRVSKSTFAGVLDLLKGSFGKARASFASTTLALGLKRRFPPFVLRHIETVRGEGRAILENNVVGDPMNPNIVFGSTAPGVESNQKMVAALQDAATTRAAKAASKLRKIVAGAVYNINTGQVYRVEDQSEDEI